MASKTARAVQVPGEPTTAAPETETEQTPEVVVADGAAEPNAADLVNDEVAQLRAQLEAERLARIEAEHRASQAAEQAASAVQVQAQAAPVVASVKPGQSAQLTKAGWVIPATYGSPVKA